MQSIFGALLTAGYATAVSAAIAVAPNADQITSSVLQQLTKSFSSAEAVAAQSSQYASAITAAARMSFLEGAEWAYGAGIIAVLIGAAIVFRYFPSQADEKRLLAEYRTADTIA
jgi:DHA2 family multidrug resistance protein-like MFS transporter